MILIVDDRPENMLPLTKILGMHGFETDTADSGEAALKKILKHTYSVIIMDVQMPGMDGFETAEMISGYNKAKDTPIIFLSAVNREKRFITKGYESGGIDYITKPVDPDILILKVRTFQKLFDQKRELQTIQESLRAEIETRKKVQEELRHMNENLEGKVAEKTKELSERNERLETINEDLQQFAWIVSHDLKEPLRKINTFLSIIEDRYAKFHPEALPYIEKTKRSSSWMSMLISNLLQYVSLSEPKKFETIDLNETVNELLLNYEEVIADKKATVITGKLPVVQGISWQMSQVFQNLLSNALKFTRYNEPPRIEIMSERISEKDFSSSTCPDGNFHRITVKDNGIGFDEKFLSKIFVIFQQLNKHEYEGTGIGLSIVKKVVDRHNGIVTAKSDGSNGSDFIIVLPEKQMQASS